MPIPHSDYRRLLADPRWQKRRLEIFARDQWQCQRCKSGLTGGRSLHVHHRQYTAETPWDEPDENLETLCERCHASEHDSWDEEEWIARVKHFKLKLSALNAEAASLFNEAAALADAIEGAKSGLTTGPVPK